MVLLSRKIKEDFVEVISDLHNLYEIHSKYVSKNYLLRLSTYTKRGFDPNKKLVWMNYVILNI